MGLKSTHFLEYNKRTNSTRENVTLSNMDTRMPKIYISFLLLYKWESTPPFTIDSFRDKLEEFVNAHYPHLFGTLEIDSEQPFIDMFQVQKLRVHMKKVDQTADTLSEYSLKQFQSSFFAAETFPAQELFQAALLEFQGGYGVSFAFHHSVMDGKGMSQFMQNFGEYVRAGCISAKPTHDRIPLIEGITKGGKCEFEHREYRLEDPKDIKHGEFPEGDVAELHFTPKHLQELKAYLGIESSRWTRNDILIACLTKWTSECRSQVTTEPTITAVNTALAVDGRLRHRPPLSDTFSGNCVFHAMPSFPLTLLLSPMPSDPSQRTSYSNSLCEIVHTNVHAMTHNYLRSALQFIENAPAKSFVQNGFDPLSRWDLDITSWVHFGLYQVNFGQGTPFICTTPLRLFPGLCIMLPGKSKGDIILAFGLRKEVYEKFLLHECVRKFFHVVTEKRG
jgi:hypothetical protein